MGQFRELLEGNKLVRIELTYKKVSSGVYEIYNKDNDFVGHITQGGFNKKEYDADIDFGDFKEFKGHFKNLKDAKTWVEATVPFQKKEDAKYRVYHSSYTKAIQEVENYAKKLGFKFDEDGQEGEQLADKVGLGPAKPKNGQTNRFSFDIYKNGKLQKKRLQVQIYGDGGDYELNMYIN